MVGSGLELIELVFFLIDRRPVTGVLIGSRAQVTLLLWGKKGGVCAKAKFRRK